MNPSVDITVLQKQIEELLKENAMLRRDFSSLSQGNSVSVPPQFKPLFDVAQQTVSEYFRHLKMEPTKGTIEINDQRYVLVRASALSKDFLDTVQNLYADRGEAEAFAIGKNFLFDIAHVIGMNDAKNFHAKMNLTDPIAKLSAGPVHFAYSGWAYVEILPESSPSPDENFYLIYHHPYSFEADSWIRSGKKADTPVCIMNAGYSSGWCEESFGIQLTAVEVSCTAMGDEHCTFIMSPPHKIQEHLDRFHAHSNNKYRKKEKHEIPTFFERKRVEEEMQKSKHLAEESAKSKSDFVANMSHELRTPLGAILGFTDLLQKTELDSAQRDYLEAINSSGNSLLSIINDILDLSKLDAGKFVIESLAFDIPELILSIQVMFQSKARKKGLQFECHIDKSINYQVLGDPMRLTQILINLIGNAIKFTEKGGVYIDCEVMGEDADKAMISFSVTDTGIGIPKDKSETIFERFTQGDSNITRKYGGTGLGLAITRQLVELQNGHISLETNGNAGTKFRVVLPYQKTTGEVHKLIARPEIDTEQDAYPRRVLIVEDNLMNQKLASIILQNNGFEIEIAEDGSKAVELLTHEKFDLILMDIQMPVMDGYRATHVIREELRLKTPIIAMTAHALAGEKDKCINAGMNDYLAKPFRESDLLSKINQWTRGKETNSNEAEDGNHTEPKKVIDLSFLFTQTKSNRPFILEMIMLFRLQNPKDIQQLEEAIAAADYPVIYKAAHSLKNTISFFGLNNYIGDDLQVIEKEARTGGNLSIIQNCFENVKPVCEKAVLELETVALDSFT